jgi:small-conductance mechanosensitive channel
MEWSKVTDWLNIHGWKILGIIVVAIVIYLLLRRLIPPILRRAVSSRMQGQPEEEIKKRADTLSGVLVGISAVLIGIVALFTILAEVGVNIAPALAGMGIAGIAIGFGAQSLVKDYLSGLFILLENQYRVGDVVRIADIAGLVEEVTLRRTVLRDLDGIVHSVPNGEIKVASNFTKEWSRVNMNISVGYGEDLDHVIEVVNRIGKEMAEDPDWSPLMLTPPQVLRVDAFEDSGIAIKILGDTKPIQQWAVMGELRRRIKKVFDEEGIEIPWPHTKVYFGGPLEQQMAGVVERRPPKRGEVPGKYETRPTEKVLPPESEEE